MDFKPFKLITLVTLAFAFSLNCNVAEAQLSRDLQDVFEGMLDDLDKDLREIFENAIKKKTNEIEFTPDQFRRLQDNPANPFEGIETINPKDIDENVILKFELPSMRNRSKNRLERQYPGVLNQLSGVTERASKSTVSVYSDSEQVALGTIVASDGLIVTKASEVADLEDLQVQFSTGLEARAKVVKVDKRNDLALLKVPTRNLLPIEWADTQPLLGSFLVNANHRNRVLHLGSYAVVPRTTVNGNQAFLGVRPRATDRGIRIGEVTDDTAAYRAGLRDGDVLLRIGEVDLKEVSDLVNAIRMHRPGDSVDIRFVRLGVERSVTAVLAGRQMSGARAKEFRMMNRLGAVPSKRADGFPSVFQHDAPLFPEQCGGPIVDLNGNVVGLNIARGGRASSYAIPSRHMKTVLADLLREDIAQRNESP